MRLYHGSNTEIDIIDLSCSKVGKDFGCGFYLSADRRQALEMANRKVAQTGIGIPTLNTYEFDLNQIDRDQVSILRFEGYSREWAEFILQNRQNRLRKPIHEYDIVIGPIADDTVGYQIRRLLAGIIDIDAFIEGLKYKRFTLQYFFATESALSLLKKINDYD